MSTMIGFDQLFQQLVEAASLEAEKRVMARLPDLMKAQQDRTLDAKEAAKYLGFSVQLLYQKCRAGEIPHWHGGKRGSEKPRVFFSLASLTEWRRNQELNGN